MAWKRFSLPLTKILKILLLTRPVWKNLTAFHNCQVDQANTGDCLELLRVVAKKLNHQILATLHLRTGFQILTGSILT